MSPSRTEETAATQLRLPAALRHQLSQLVEASYPCEACGLLLGRAGNTKIDVVRIAPARNLNRERPGDRYLLDPQGFLAADRAARAQRLEIVGIWHSHPNGTARPLSTDLDAAWEGYSYLIIPATSAGAGEYRSWRLASDHFEEEILEEEDTTP